MTARALDFAQAHPATDASYVAVVSALTDRLERANTIAVQEQLGVAGGRSAIGRRAAFKQMIQRQLQHLFRVARRAGESDPELGRKILRVASNAPNRVLAIAAHVQLDLVVAREAEFVALGLGEGFVAELRAALEEFDRMTTEAHQGRTDHVSGGGDLRALAAECMNLRGLLDGLNQGRFRKEPGLQLAWDSARHVVGSFQRQVEEIAPTPIADSLPLGSGSGPVEGTASAN